MLERVKRFLGSVTVEPPIFITLFAFGLQSIIAQNLVIDRVCRVSQDFPDAICDNLEAHKDIQIGVQKQVNLILMYATVLGAIPNITISLIVGPWSDYNGRKPIILLPVFGYVLKTAVLFLLTLLPQLGGEWYLLTIVSDFFGGFACVLTGVFSYISDISPRETRTVRVAFVDLALFSGYPIGSFFSAYTFAYGGYIGTFAVSMGLLCIVLMYVYFLIKETRGPNATTIPLNPIEQHAGDPNHSILGHIKSVFKTCFKRRENRNRRQILLLMLSMTMNLTAMTTSSITYLYTRLKFNWTEKEFTSWLSINSLVTILGTAIFLPTFSRVFKIRDGFIGISGAISGIAMNVTLALITQSWMMYLSSAMGCMSSFSAVCIRSMISKIGPEGDLGKIFSLLSSLEATAPIISSPLLSLVYNASIETFPGAVYLLQCGLFLMVSGIIGYVFYIQVTDGPVQYGTLPDAAEEVDDADEERSPSADDIISNNSTSSQI